MKSPGFVDADAELPRLSMKSPRFVDADAGKSVYIHA